MRFGTYALFVFCLAVVAWWMGMTSPFQETIAKQNGGNPMDFQTTVGVVAAGIVKNGDIWIAAIIGMVLTGFATGLLQGFSANFIVPILILLAVFQYFVMPLSFLFNDSLDPMVRLPLMFLLNMFMVLAIVDFVRGKT